MSQINTTVTDPDPTQRVVRLISDNNESTYLSVPTHVLPSQHNRSTQPLGVHLGSLYLKGNSFCDSFDVGLSYASSQTFEIPVVSRPSYDERKELRKEMIDILSRDNTNLTRRVEALEDANVGIVATNKVLVSTNKVILTRWLANLNENLKSAKLIQEVETWDRILQAYNDQIFRQLSEDEMAFLRSEKFTFISKLLDPPDGLHPHKYEQLDIILGNISAQRRDAAQAFLPLLRQLKDGPFGRNALQHPPPTTEEAISNIMKSTLNNEFKSTLIADINDGYVQSRAGEDLFLSANVKSNVQTIEDEIAELTLQLELLQLST